MSEPWIGKREDRWTDILPESWQSAINTSPVVNALGRFMQPRTTFDQAARDWQDSLPGNSPIDRIADGRSTLAKEYPKPWSPFAADLMENGNALAIFLGPAAKTANLGALARARQMQASGVPRENIWQQEGWFQGPDKKWRFEVDDSKAMMSDISKRERFDVRGLERPPTRLADELRHPSLYEAYPDMANIKFSPSAGSGGSFTAGNAARPDRIRIGQDVPDARSVGLHEVQHGIQKREDFARGGSPEGLSKNLYEKISAEIDAITPPHGRVMDATTAKTYSDLKKMREIVGQGDYEAYRHLAGEAEARAVQVRRNMTPEQRQERPPWLDYDVPEDRQIVRYHGGGVMRSEPDPIVDAWNKGKTIKEIAYETGGDYQAIRKALVDARASGAASPERARTVRAGLTDEMIMNAIREGKTLKQIAQDNGYPHQTVVTRTARMRENGAFEAPDAPAIPVKGTKAREWSADDLAAMEKQYNSGMTTGQIAEQFGVSAESINKAIRDRVEFRRNGTPRTDADVEAIRQRRLMGMPYSRIAEELGMPRNGAISLAHRARRRGVEIPAAAALTYGAIEAALNGQDQQF